MMTVQEFVDWVQSNYKLPTHTAAVKKAAELMKTGETTIWQWLSGKRKTSQSMLLLMDLIARYYKSPEGVMARK